MFSTAATLLVGSLGRNRPHRPAVTIPAGTMRRLIGDLLDIDALEKGTLKIAPALHETDEVMQSVHGNFAPG